ncbi:MAG: ShlB/FhaC/HecB family hemolysin secretion/activation protein, partial [Verrucomicrobiota bacterium]
VSLGLGRTQQVGRDYSLALNVRGQAAFHNLDSSEKFFLGGNNGLRAYPTSEGGGDLGMLSSLELRTNLTPRTQGTLFLDQGWVAQNYDPDYAGGPTDNGLTYRGWGLGLSQRFDSGVKLSLQWSRRIGDNPRPSSSGTDQDGSLRIDRFWASASFNF